MNNNYAKDACRSRRNKAGLSSGNNWRGWMCMLIRGSYKGNKKQIKRFERGHPEVDERALAKRVVELVIQVNGKLRGKLGMAPDAIEDYVVREARKIENVEKFLDGKETQKVIHVPGKLLNFVVS